MAKITCLQKLEPSCYIMVTHIPKVHAHKLMHAWVKLCTEDVENCMYQVEVSKVAMTTHSPTKTEMMTTVFVSLSRM